MTTHKTLACLPLLLLNLSAVSLAYAQVNTSTAVPAAASTSANCEAAVKEQLFQELAGFDRYASSNAALGPPRPHEQRVVFMGDSITEFWAKIDPEFFARTKVIDRGISGQTSLQMLLRFRADVIALKPTVVHILAGTNDLAGNTGRIDLAGIEANIASMVDLARANGISVVIGSVLPATEFPWRKGLNPGPKIAALNQWLRRYAQSRKLSYVDYYDAVTDGALGMRPGLSQDGVHPSREGYLIMDSLAEPAIKAASIQAHLK